MKKVLTVIGGLFLVLVIVVAIILIVTSLTSKKLVCKSNEGNITIMYNDKTITGYTAKGITYDMDVQKQIAEQIGIESYITQFESWFKTNTTGSCTK